MNSRYLTSTNPELEALVRGTHPGQAHWAGSGPAGKTCAGCVFWVIPGRIRLCRKYKELMGHWAKKPLPANAAACRHFEAKPKLEKA
jgi:hypothetical protein